LWRLVKRRFDGGDLPIRSGAEQLNDRNLFLGTVYVMLNPLPVSTVLIGAFTDIANRGRGPQPHQLDPLPGQLPQLTNLRRGAPRLGREGVGLSGQHGERGRVVRRQPSGCRDRRG
jgi:hypothetical protein